MSRKPITNFDEVEQHLDQLDFYIGNVNMRVRTIEEIIDWSVAPEAKKRQIWLAINERRAAQ
jgi:hypothetical protein